jgi:hypothetical protein
MGASGCIAAARVQGLVETGAACPPGSSGNPGRPAAAGPELAVAGTGVTLTSAVAGIGAGGAAGVRSPLPSAAGSQRSAGGPVAIAASGETPGMLGGAGSPVEPSPSPLAAGCDGGAARNRWAPSVPEPSLGPGTDTARRIGPSSLQPGSSAGVGKLEGGGDGALRHAGAL